MGIDVTRAGNLEPGEAIEMTQRGHNLRRNDFWRLAQLARQLEGNRRGQFAKLELRRNFQRNGLKM
jgi:hypothetical protein